GRRKEEETQTGANRENRGIELRFSVLSLTFCSNVLKVTDGLSRLILPGANRGGGLRTCEPGPGAPLALVKPDATALRSCVMKRTIFALSVALPLLVACKEKP